jgi:hypothetical protein
MCQSKDLKSFSVEYHIVVGLGVEKDCPTMTQAKQLGHCFSTEQGSISTLQ